MCTQAYHTPLFNCSVHGCTSHLDHASECSYSASAGALYALLSPRSRYYVHVTTVSAIKQGRLLFYYRTGEVEKCLLSLKGCNRLLGPRWLNCEVKGNVWHKKLHCSKLPWLALYKLIDEYMRLVVKEAKLVRLFNVY